MRILYVLVALGLFGPSAVALTARHIVHQQGRAFSAEPASVRKGELVTFLNDDSVSHNVMSISPGNEFDLGSQRPGTSTDVTFNQTGTVQVICAIHPRMKMTITVVE